MRRSNPERKARLRSIQFGKQASLCETLPCSVPGCCAGPPCDAHHEPTRAAGGKDRDTVPLCHPHHDERHDHGIKTFEVRHGINLREIARALSESL